MIILLECDALDNDIRSLFMAFYPGRAIKRIETKEYACAEGDLFLRVCMSDCAETQCLANEDNTKKKMTMELMQDGTLLEDACECELSDRKDTKTKAKCMLYCLLSKLQKRSSMGTTDRYPTDKDCKNYADGRCF